MAKIARGNKKPFSARFGQFRGSGVREGKIADIGPEEDSGWGEGGLVFALHNVADNLVGGVESGQTGDMVGYGTVYHWGVALKVNLELTEGIRDKRIRVGIHGHKGEIWFFLFDEVPCSLFGKSFASEVATIGVLECFFYGDVIPVFLGVDVAWSISLCSIDDRSEGACDDLSK